MPDSYQISVATPEVHRGKRDGAQRQAGVAASGWRWPGRCNLAPEMRVLVLVAAVSCFAGCGVESLFVGEGCTDSATSTWDLHEPTDPATTLKIEDCRMDVGACDVLCTMELDANQTSSDTMTNCTVRFDGDTIHVQVDYDVPSNGPGCEQQGFGGVETPNTTGAQ